MPRENEREELVQGVMRRVQSAFCVCATCARLGEASAHECAAVHETVPRGHVDTA